MLLSPAPTRRAFLTRAAALAGIAAVASIAVAPNATAVTPSSAWKLRCTNNCHCRACRLHAANKVFATEAAALAGRAHPGCRCTPVAVATTAASYTRLFTGANSVDRRSPGITAALAAAGTPSDDGAATPQSAPSATTLTATGAATATTSEAPGDGGVAASRASATPPAESPTANKNLATIDPPTPSASASPSRTMESTTVARSHALDERWIPAPLAAIAATVGGLIWLRNRKTDRVTADDVRGDK